MDFEKDSLVFKCQLLDEGSVEREQNWGEIPTCRGVGCWGGGLDDVRIKQILSTPS